MKNDEFDLKMNKLIDSFKNIAYIDIRYTYYIINTIFLASICTFVPPNLALQFSKKIKIIRRKEVQVIETFTPLQPWSLLESPNSPGMFV